MPLIERIRARGFNVLATTGTVTSAALAEKRLPPGAVHQFIPLDLPPFVARFLDYWRPDLALFVESDLWPNIIMSAAERDIPMILVNGRMSERSFRRWRHFPRTIEALLTRFDLCLVRTTDDAERFGALGAPRITTTGNLKLDVPALPVDTAKIAILASATRAGRSSPPLRPIPARRARSSTPIAASPSHFPGLLTIIAPRHPQRGPAIADIATAARLRCALRSRGELPDGEVDIYLFDTLGELGLVYQLAPIVFMGGSLVRHGGQNPIEAVKLGAAILHGPHVANFAEIYDELDGCGGADFVTDAGTLTVRIAGWIKDGPARDRAAAAAKRMRRPARRRARTHGRRARTLFHAIADPGPRRRCVSPVSGGGAMAPRRGSSPRPAPPMASSRRGGWRSRAGGPPCRSCASAISPWAAAARRRPPSPPRGFSSRRAAVRSFSRAAMADGSPVRCGSTEQPADAVGDEPLLLARIAPTIVARDRPAGADAAAQAGADAIVMDDGWQNPSLAKDLVIAVLDGRRGIGNGRVFPAGPLRAPLECQLDRADAMLVIGHPAAGAAPAIAAGRRRSLPRFEGELVPDPAAMARLAGAPRARIRRHRRSRQVLRHARSRRHHGGGTPELPRPSSLYGGGNRRACSPMPTASNLVLVTTEKDLVRLAGDPHARELVARADCAAGDAAGPGRGGVRTDGARSGRAAAGGGPFRRAPVAHGPAGRALRSRRLERDAAGSPALRCGFITISMSCSNTVSIFIKRSAE